MYGAGAQSPTPEYRPFFACGYGSYFAMRHVLGLFYILVVDVFVSRAFPVPVDQIFHDVLLSASATALADV